MLDTLLISGFVTVAATPVFVYVIELLEKYSLEAFNSPPFPAGASMPPLLQASIESHMVSGDQSGAVAANSTSVGGGTDPITGILHDVPVDVSEIIISGFQPGLDVCRIWLRSPEIDFDHRAGTAGVVLVFHDGVERLSITFQGLKNPPIADIEAIFDCPGNGQQVRRLTGPGDGSAERAIEDQKDAAWRLAAWAETERALEAFDASVPEVAGQVHSPSLPEIAGFDANSECVEVWVPGVSESDVEVDVVSTPGGEHGMILVAGRPAALLSGVPQASPRNIRVVPMTACAACRADCPPSTV